MSTAENLQLSSIGTFRCPECNSQEVWEFVNKPVSRLNSLTAVASCSICDSRIFLKKMKVIDGVPAVQCAENEFNASTRLSTLFDKSSDLDIAEPLQRLGSIIVFEYIQGASPVKALKLAPCADAASIMERLGIWFAKLHEASDKGKSSGDLAGRLEAMVAWSNRQKRHSTIARALIYLQSHLAETEEKSSQLRQLHGDAKPENFLVEEGRIVGIDIVWRFLHFPENDLAQFLTQYELSVCGLFGQIDSSRRRLLESAFVAGYRSMLPANDQILAWLRVYSLLHLWLRCRGVSFLRRLYWDIVFKRRMHCLLLDYQKTRSVKRDA